MITVGEMVEAILGISDWADDWASRDSDCEWASALKSLGIWDTEVLEGEGRVVPVREGTVRYSVELDGEHVPSVSVREPPFWDGKRVRVIVLPFARQRQR